MTGVRVYLQAPVAVDLEAAKTSMAKFLEVLRGRDRVGFGAVLRLQRTGSFWVAFAIT